MAPRTIVLGGVEARLVETTRAGAEGGAPVVVLLHGFSMRADDLAPFGASLGVEGSFLFPEGVLDLAPHGLAGRAWWLIDVARRDAAVAGSIDRDLSSEIPAGLPAARDNFLLFLERVAETWPGRPLFLGGFSQGAILSLDIVLRTRPRLAGLILLSGARVTAEAWKPLLGAVRDLPIFQSHGRNDRELSYTAAEALGADLTDAGAARTWWPFEGGHEIPLVVFREIKKFIRRNIGHSPTPPFSS